MRVLCALCGDEMDADRPGAYQRVTGWETRRKGGGTNAIKLRKPLHEFAHKTCVEASAKGRRGQAALDV